MPKLTIRAILYGEPNPNYRKTKMKTYIDLDIETGSLSDPVCVNAW